MFAVEDERSRLWIAAISSIRKAYWGKDEFLTRWACTLVTTLYFKPILKEFKGIGNGSQCRTS